MQRFATKLIHGFIRFDNNFKKIENENITIVQNIYINDDSLYFIPPGNDLYVFGGNQNGQLGLSHSKYQKTIIKQKLFKNNTYLIGQSKTQSAHCFVYTFDNKLYAMGYNSSNQLGIETKNTSETYPILIKFKFSSILKQINCGGYHTLFLTKNGKVYGSGKNRYGQLGLDIRKNFKIIFINTLNNYNIINIKCGEESSIVLNDKKQLFVFGSNGFGQLGINDKDCLFLSKPIKICDNIKNFICGHSHNGFLTNDFKVKIFGYNRYGQCGLLNNEEFKRIHKPNEIILNNKINYIDCGESHTIIKTIQNEYYSFGQNDYEQCLLQSNIQSVCKPTLISIDYIESNKFELKCGGTMTYIFVEKFV